MCKSMYMYRVYTCVHRGYKIALETWNSVTDSFRCWELSLGALQEHPVLLTFREPSLHPSLKSPRV